MKNTKSYHQNSQKPYKSDIFNTKGLNNDVNYSHIKENLKITIKNHMIFT